MRTFKYLAIFIATVWALPTPAQASYSIEIFDDGVLQGGIGTLVIGNSLLFSGSTTNFSITNGSGTSNNPGTSAGSSLSLSSNEQITTTFGTAGGTHTIEIVLSQTGFTAPIGTPLLLSSSAGGSITANGGSLTVSSTYQGFLDITNTLFGMPAAGSTPVQNASNTASGTATAGLVYNPDPSKSTISGGTPFSITDVLIFTFTVGAGSGQDTAEAAVTTTATTPVPEPSSLVLLGAALLGFGLRRRRKQT